MRGDGRLGRKVEVGAAGGGGSRVGGVGAKREECRSGSGGSGGGSPLTYRPLSHRLAITPSLPSPTPPSPLPSRLHTLPDLHTAIQIIHVMCISAQPLPLFCVPVALRYLVRPG